MKRIVTYIIISIILLFSLIAVLYLIETKSLFHPKVQYGPSEYVNYPKENTRKIVTVAKISKNTTFPLIINYPKGIVRIAGYFYGKDIWTEDNIPIPKVTVNSNDAPIEPDLGFGILLGDGTKLRYASYRSIRPDKLFDSKPYKVIEEVLLKSTVDNTQNTKDLLRYYLELEPENLDLTDLSFKVFIVSEEITVGEMRIPILN